jgi:hypothetical protein
MKIRDFLLYIYYKLHFVIHNISSLESATRFLKDYDQDGYHNSIIDNKKKGEGLKLGGTISETWEWDELIELK